MDTRAAPVLVVAWEVGWQLTKFLSLPKKRRVKYTTREKNTFLAHTMQRFKKKSYIAVGTLQNVTIKEWSGILAAWNLRNR